MASISNYSNCDGFKNALTAIISILSDSHYPKLKPKEISNKCILFEYLQRILEVVLSIGSMSCHSMPQKHTKGL